MGLYKRKPPYCPYRKKQPKGIAKTAKKVYGKSMKTAPEINTPDSVMDGFFRGMGSISLFPQLPDPDMESSPWQGVLDAFEAADRNLTDAIYEFRNA